MAAYGPTRSHYSLGEPDPARASYDGAIETIGISQRDFIILRSRSPAKRGLWLIRSVNLWISSTKYGGWGSKETHLGLPGAGGVRDSALQQQLIIHVHVSRRESFPHGHPPGEHARPPSLCSISRTLQSRVWYDKRGAESKAPGLPLSLSLFVSFGQPASQPHTLPLRRQQALEASELAAPKTHKRSWTPNIGALLRRQQQGVSAPSLHCGFAAIPAPGAHGWPSLPHHPS